MRHQCLSFIAMAPSSPSLSKSPAITTTTTTTKKPSSSPNSNLHPNSSNCSSSSHLCKHSASATLDILILILVLFSGAFLISSYFSYIFQSLSLILPTISLSTTTILLDSTILYLIGFAFFVVAVISFEICWGFKSKKCGKLGCKGLKKAMEFDLQLQTEECLRSTAAAIKEVDELPWKGGTEGNPDYECLRAELRKMAPPSGRAVLLFRAKCGCPVAKLEGWRPKRGRRNKK